MPTRTSSLVGVLLAALSAPVAAYQIDYFPATTHSTDTAAMDAALGLSGLTLEGFEGGAFATGLTVELTGPGGTLETLTSYSGLTLGAGFVWDGSSVFENTGSSAGSDADVAFNLASGVGKFGVGLSGMGLDGFLQLFINDIEIAPVSDPGWTIGHGSRNGYLRISAEAGDAAITSVGFQFSTATETLYFDHVAFGAAVPGTADAPAPAPVALFAVGLVGVCLTRTRRQVWRTADRI
ncbi:MAG: hypothetical protein AAF458_20190 [Pseudomonadota bacterium]